MALLNAYHRGGWTLEQVQGTLEMLFERQYTLTETVTVETRYDGGAAHHRQNALRQHGAGGHPIEEDAHHQKQADHNEKAKSPACQ